MMYVVVALVIVLIGAYFLFRRTMNLFQSIGPVYWMTRDNGSGWSIKRAYARATFPPWKIGKGLQFSVGQHTFQVGICHKAPLKDPYDEIEGLEYVLGRPYDEA